MYNLFKHWFLKIVYKLVYNLLNGAQLHHSGSVWLTVEQFWYNTVLTTLIGFRDAW